MKNHFTKTCIMAISIFLVAQTLQAQVWDSLGMGAGIAGGSGSTNYVGTFNGNIYDGGLSDGSIKQWDGFSWTGVGGGLAGPITYINGFAEYKGYLYVMGYFDSVTGLGGLHDIARWDGSHWSGVGGGFPVFDASISSMVVYDSILYVGGRFDTAGNISARNIAKWNGSNWSAVAGHRMDSIVIINGYPNQTSVTSLGLYNGKLVVSGIFDSIGGIAARNIALWNGTNWSAVGSGIDYPASAVLGNGTSLYAIGDYLDSAGGLAVNKMAVWNGTAWSAWGKGTAGNVYTLATYNGNTFVGGAFDSMGGIVAHNIAQFNGTSWYGVGGGIDSNWLDPFVNIVSMVVANNSLYVAGNFTTAGKIHGADGIARWGAPRVQGINSVSDNNAVNVYPNPGNGILNIALKGVTELCQVEVYNLLGEKIFHAFLNSTNTTITIGKHSSGAYLYRIIKEDGALISSGKYILE